MGFAVDCLQLFDAHMGVNARCFELFVSQQLLDEADVCPAFEHVRGTAMAEDVAGACFADVGLFDELADHAAYHIRVEGFAVAGDEQGFFIGA